MKREKRKREKQKYQELLYVLKQYTLKKAEEEKGPLYRKAIERNLRKTGSKRLLNPEKIFNLLKVYEEAALAGEKLSLEELAEKVKITNLTFLGKLLKEMDLEPMYGARNKIQNLTETQIETINRAYHTPFYAQDIGYFVNILSPTIHQRWKRIGANTSKKEGKRHFIKNFGFGKNNNYLTYRKASRIYQDIDENKKYSLGFSLEEIAVLNDTTQEAVKYAVNKRKEIEPDIKEVLKILYPGKRIERPYITARLKK